MTYTPLTWVDVPDPQNPPVGALALEAANLQHMDDGIADAHVLASFVGIPVTTLTGAAIQAAIDSASPGDFISLDAATYTVTSRIELKDGVTLIGRGAGATVLQATSGITTAVVVGVSGDSVTDAAVRDLTVDAGSLAGINGVQVASGARFHMDRCVVQNAQVGVWVNATSDSTVGSVRVTNCSSRGLEISGARTVIQACNVSSTADTGILVTGAPDCRVLDCWVTATGATGATKHGVVVVNSPRTQVRGNYIVPAGGMGVFGDTSTDIEITSNLVDCAASTLECVGVNAGCVGARFQANAALNGRDNGISVSAPLATVVGNRVVSARKMGIQANASDITVQANTVKNCGQEGGATNWAGIDVNSGTHCVVTGNRCFDDQGTKTQKYGVTSRNGADYLTLAANDLVGNSTAETLLVGSNNTIVLPKPIPVSAGGLGATYAVNQAQLYNHFRSGTLTADLTVTVNNPQPGGTLDLLLVQDGTGGRTLTVAHGDAGNVYRSAASKGAGSTVAISTVAGRRDLVNVTTSPGGSLLVTVVDVDYS